MADSAPRAVGTDSFGLVGNTIRTRSGGYFDFSSPHPSQFKFSDLAGALAKTCRFGGQCEKFYSVAEHSVICSCLGAYENLPTGCLKALLMHDAAEALVGDCVKPLKVMLPQFDLIEAAAEEVIAQKYGIDFATYHTAVKTIDKRMVIHEKRQLFSRDDVVWADEHRVEAIDYVLPCWDWELAEKQFTNLAMALGINTRI